jgi:PEGA domain.
MRAWSKPWIAIGGGLALLMVAGAVSCRKNPARPAPANVQSDHDAQSLVVTPPQSLVWIESTPPGASIVRVSDGFILGWTPETTEFIPSPKPVLIRFELEGYLPLTREVPVATDGEISVVLEEIPKGRAAGTKATKKSKGTKARTPSK